MNLLNGLFKVQDGAKILKIGNSIGFLKRGKMYLHVCRNPRKIL